MKKYQSSYLEWDSNFFGRKIYRIDLIDMLSRVELNSIANKLDADLIYVFSKNELEIEFDENFSLVDRKTIFQKNYFDDAQYFTDSNIISSHTLSPFILDLAFLSGHYSRFKTDHILFPKFFELYRLWIEKSLRREMANEVFSYMDNQKEIAFVTIKKFNENASIGLIAVDPNYHGKNLGSLLIKSVEKWCINNQIVNLEVATQEDNIKACNFYSKNGFTIKKIDYVYHYHKK